MGKKQLSFLSSRTPKKTEEHHKQHATVSPNLEGPQTITTPQEPPLLKEGAIEKVKRTPMVEAYAKEILRWSKIVYGRGNVLRKETEEILENPEIKDSLLKQIKENPASIHSLAGMKMFNFKTHRRKEAEQAVPYLCSAIDVYTQAVKYAYENMNIKISEENVTVKKSLQKSLDIQQKKASFSNEPLINTEKNQSSVGQCYAEIERLSQLVYGNQYALQKQMEEILERPIAGIKLAWIVAVYPKSFHKLAGRNLCGFKNDERRRAEENLLPLYDAIRNYTKAVQEAKDPTLQEQQMQQKRTEELERQKQEIMQKVQKIRERHQTLKRNTQPEKSADVAVHAKVSSVKTSPFNDKSIDMIKNSPDVRRHYANVQFWTKLAYGDDSVLQKQMEDILKNPACGEQISQEVAKNPASFHGLAGRKVGSFKNNARKCAEDSIQHLEKALKHYTDAIQQAKEGVSRQLEMQERFIVSKSPRQEPKQKFQKTPEKQYAQQYHAQQHKAKSMPGRALAL